VPGNDPGCAGALAAGPDRDPHGGRAPVRSAAQRSRARGLRSIEPIASRQLTWMLALQAMARGEPERSQSRTCRRPRMTQNTSILPLLAATSATNPNLSAWQSPPMMVTSPDWRSLQPRSGNG